MHGRSPEFPFRGDRGTAAGLATVTFPYMECGPGKTRRRVPCCHEGRGQGIVPPGHDGRASVALE